VAHDKIIVISLGTWFYFSTQLGIAQSATPVEDEPAHTALATNRSGAPADISWVPADIGRAMSERSPIASANVLDDVPRAPEIRSATNICHKDRVSDQMRARCLRWLEIARTP
jgi:hypothetical protein